MGATRFIPFLAFAITAAAHAQTLPPISAVPADAALRSARSIAPPVVAATRARVGIWLSPDLGDATPRLRTLLRAAGVEETGTPVDFELTTKRNYPQTLILIDRAERPEAWRFSRGEGQSFQRRPTTIELGNLITGDYAKPLAAALRKLRRARALATLPQSARAATVTCLTGYTDASPTCHDSAGYRVAGTGKPASAEIVEQRGVAAAIRNVGEAPVFIRLLVVGPDGVVSEVPLIGTQPLSPGVWAESTAAWKFEKAGDHVLVTIASRRPFARGADPTIPTPDATVDVYHLFVDHQTVVLVGGGLPVVAGMAPWMAELYSTVPYSFAEIAADAIAHEDKRQYLWRRSAAERGHRCGGSLIAPDLVLTAAHCVAKGDFAGANASKVLTRRRIRVGTIDLGSGGTTYAIDAVAVHAGYVAGRTPNDIALLRLKADRDTLRLPLPQIALADGRAAADPAQRDGAPLVAFGWGYTGMVAPDARTVTDFDGNVQHNPGVLQFGELQTLGWPQCRQRMGSDLGKEMLCAVSRVDPRTGIAPRKVFSCVGDSGGPLTTRVGAADVLVGIASWSRGCGFGDYPSVYTDVARYGDWIARARAALRPGQAVRVAELAAAAAAR